jgi:DNA-binding response OmpR family regulator
VNILIIEDDRRIASFLERGLAAEGYKVAAEYDGRDGL